MNRKLAIGLAIALSAAVVGSAGAREHHRHDHEFARGALQRGEVLPINRLLSITAQYLPGDVVEVRLEPRRDGELRYEIRVLTPSGKIRELLLDARTGDYIGIED
ncbi:MAG TPA: PepSY domain-containing protein [Micropepsaceae bacterium]|nr:PepSY domain-containing protein [Micropepsaceae bacterium]